MEKTIFPQSNERRLPLVVFWETLVQPDFVPEGKRKNEKTKKRKEKKENKSR